ncbi:MAG: 4a-hydroxytetrahydrobiopterin dehydratase [Candidatus Poseidoniales archaeon]|jgi:4a-hydroxytetrahydrobiopterin dehydratase|tara:strand:+ start:140 stop:466 length:327 start_codon:yes stop_codon:yes gene_type:complete
MELSDKKCVPCQGGVPPLREKECDKLLDSLESEWEVISLHHLERKWKFNNFIDALNFTNKLGNVCEIENHHADFEIGWGRVKVVIYTHKINGLTESDFILAAKFDNIN